MVIIFENFNQILLKCSFMAAILKLMNSNCSNIPVSSTDSTSNTRPNFGLNLFSGVININSKVKSKDRQTVNEC